MRSIAAAGFVLLVAAGCTRHLNAKVTQPALVLASAVSARTSIPLEIVVRDMEMGRFRLRNTAYYVVVSRDRLRFHVTLHHKWDEVADLRNWTVSVEDGNGKRHYPEDLSARVKPVFTWNANNATYRMNHLLYRGTADLTIYDRDLFTTGRELTLVLSRPEVELRYHWTTAAFEADT